MNLHDEHTIRQALEKTQSSKTKVNLLVDLAYLIRLKDPEETDLLLCEVHKLSESGDLEPSMANMAKEKIKIINGSVAFKKAQYDQSILLINESILALEETDENMWVSRAYNILGSCYGQMGNQSESIEAISRSLSIAREGDFKREIASALNIMATFEDDSSKLYEEAIAISIQINNQEMHAISCANLAREYLSKGLFKKAEEKLLIAEEVSTNISQWGLLGYVFATQGELYQKMGALDAAAKKIKAGIKLARNSKDYFMVCGNLEALARLEKERGNLDVALAYVDEALDLSIDIHEQLITQELFKLKSDCLAEIGDFESALAYSWQFIESKSESFNQEKEKQRQALIITHQAETFKLESHLEKQKNIELEQQVHTRTLALQEALEQAQTANIARDKFLATMSHELRTPINAIKGYSEIVAEILEDSPENDDTEEMSHSIESVLLSSNNLLSLIDDVLNISQLESKRTNLQVEEFLLDDVIGELTTLLKIQITANQNSLKISNSYPFPAITSDKRKLIQILLNILNNAAKFTSKGDIEFSITQSDSHGIVFQVSDTGVGISEEKLEVIFEPFMQIEDAYNRQFEGVGLGLAICKQLANALGGGLTATSQLGKGSVFRLEIPSTQSA